MHYLISVLLGYLFISTAVHAAMGKEASNTQCPMTILNLASPCANWYGAQYKDCVLQMGVVRTLEILEKMSADARTKFMRLLTYDDYKEIVSEMTDDLWCDFLCKLSDQERSIWPKSVKDLERHIKSVDDIVTAKAKERNRPVITEVIYVSNFPFYRRVESVSIGNGMTITEMCWSSYVREIFNHKKA